MQENEEKPDLVVWDNERGYYQKGLSYGSNVSAPAIKLDNVSGWKQSNADVANKNFKTKFDELKEEYDYLNWVDIDITNDPLRITRRFGVSSVPTMVIATPTEKIGSFTGTQAMGYLTLLKKVRR